MEQSSAFYDYCINEECLSKDFEGTMDLLFRYGFRTIAVNQILNEENLQPKKKKKKGETRDGTDILPEPIQFKKIEKFEDIKILNRLTVVFSNQDVIHKVIKSPNYKKYHIISVLPTSQQAFQFTCSNVEADIITFDPINKLNYRLNRRLYNQLVGKGMHFELLYSPLILDTTQRKNSIQLAHMLHTFGKSKNIIISSGATEKLYIRSPYDVINLGFILGLNQHQSKNAITHLGRNVFVNSVGRKYGKTIAIVKNVNESAEDNSQSNSEDEMDLLPLMKKLKQ